MKASPMFAFEHNQEGDVRVRMEWLCPSFHISEIEQFFWQFLRACGYVPSQDDREVEMQAKTRLELIKTAIGHSLATEDLHEQTVHYLKKMLDLVRIEPVDEDFDMDPDDFPLPCSCLHTQEPEEG